MGSVAENSVSVPTPLKGYYTRVGAAINQAILEGPVWESMFAATDQVGGGLNYWESKSADAIQGLVVKPFVHTLAAAESFALAIKAKTVLTHVPVRRRGREVLLTMVQDSPVGQDVDDDGIVMRRNTTSPPLAGMLAAFNGNQVKIGKYLDAKWRAEGVLPKAG